MVTISDNKNYPSIIIKYSLLSKALDHTKKHLVSCCIGDALHSQ